ncbi:DHHA1 domain-containing protein [Ammoniphilus sp. CFH 90114]|uniref:alanyl-tRNA editing protein n=1 Tax=Ammoniphilus sp. CFH 90114 TaxID=2493665 RepID=UPI00100EE1EE|nr:DHHA1 domain-containing protein [Ammoniphilus sp. CFH 90114]RXT07192.1 alanyl-tRNA editing protein [Ammoniphilus sp. CFH 90114]
MPTEKLYYEDPYIRSFTSQLIRQDQDEKGRCYVVLEQTAFYPTGGGQPYDTGHLHDVAVYDVEEVEGEIRHFIERPLEVHNELTGVIHWDRRFDHMQQHAGQHILSAAFEQEYGYSTVSFHLGKETCTIDLPIADLRHDEAKEVEALANRIILENRPIEAKWVTKEELSQYSLRKDLSVSENIRLVIIPNFDYNGCGGTHPDSTGKVGSLKILHWEKQKKNIRIHFVCGDRVLKHLHEKHQVIQSLTSVLNAPQEQLKEAALRVLQQTKDLEKMLNDLKAELMGYEADEFLDQAEIHPHHQVVKASFIGRPIFELQQLAKTITMKSDKVLVVFINEDENRLQLICARGRDLQTNMNQLVKGVLPLINGKGGGNDTFAQGGGEKTISVERLMQELDLFEGET